MKLDPAKTCFVAMTIGHRPSAEYNRWKKVYETIIKKVVEVADPTLVCYRADENMKPSEWWPDVIDHLYSDFLCIADVTGQNANVYYELGLRDVWHDRTIIITQNMDDVKVDKRDINAFLYSEDDLSLFTEFQVRIREAVQDINSNPQKIRNSVRRFQANWRGTVAKSLNLQWKTNAPVPFKERFGLVLNALGMVAATELAEKGPLLPYRQYGEKGSELILVFSDVVTDPTSLSVQSRLAEGLRTLLEKIGRFRLSSYQRAFIYIPVDCKIDDAANFLKALQQTQVRNTLKASYSLADDQSHITYETLLRNASFVLFDRNKMDEIENLLVGKKLG